MRHLFAWEDELLVGRFDQNDSGLIRFEYSPQCMGSISLSLPMTGTWNEDAPRNFLEGLLPDGDTERLRMRNALGAKSTDVFDLLDAVDSSGGLIFTSEEVMPAPATGSEITPITPDDIEAQMNRVWQTSDAWWKIDSHNRFSLAGSQGKFSVAIHGSIWFWPQASLPSTHILKPNGKRVPDVAEVENATMELARLCTIDVPQNEVVHFGKRTGYLVERFDRIAINGVTHRIRCEDLAQAMGISPDDKYEPELADAIACLRRGGADEDVLLDLVRQMAFNAAVGNADAHAKNYSILLDGGDIRLSPLYDAISMAHWEQFKYGTLSMPVNGVYDPWEVTLADWRAEATRCGLDPDAVEAIVRDVTIRLVEADYETLPCSREVAREIEGYVHECTRDLLPDIL